MPDEMYLYYLFVCGLPMAAGSLSYFLIARLSDGGFRSAHYFISLNITAFKCIALGGLFYIAVLFCGQPVDPGFQVGDLGEFCAFLFILSASVRIIIEEKHDTADLVKYGLISLIFPVILLVVNIILYRNIDYFGEKVLLIPMSLIGGVAGFFTVLNCLLPDGLTGFNTAFRRSNAVLTALVAASLAYRFIPIALEESAAAIVLTIVYSALIIIAAPVLIRGGKKWVR